MVEKHSGLFFGSGLEDDAGISFESELRVLVVVAHPDDETLWAGGTMLMYSDWVWNVVSLCRGADRDRRARFFGAMTRFGARGRIGELDDGPDQHPLSDSSVRAALLFELENTNFDLLITHSPFGEYTRHVRHEEVGRTVCQLWQTGALNAKELWLFAYTDNEKTHYPKAVEDAHLKIALPRGIWQEKLTIIEKIYGFGSDSWEALTTPRHEAFWRFQSSAQALAWHRDYQPQLEREAINADTKKGNKNESACSI